MDSQYDTRQPDQQVAARYSQELAQHLETFLGPLLVWLDAAIDVRLVRTFVESIAAIIRFRNRAEGLYLSELGSYLLDGEHAPAGTKRLGNLLRSSKWGKSLIERYLWTQADRKIESLEQEEQECLLIWDGSVIEKPESEKAEGLCAVRSSKARRLKRPRKGAYNHAGGKPIVVLGMEWIGMIVVGLQGVPAVATMRWWSRKGAQASTLREQERGVLLLVTRRWGRRVINIFDRGYAGGPWLSLLSMFKERFVIRWKKGHVFGDQQGQEKKLWEIARGKRSFGHRQIWDAKSRCYRKMGIVSMRVRHASYAGWLWLVVVRTGKDPWYLITNEWAEGEEQAWRVAMLYARRWQIEMSFRYGKSEMGMESPRMRKWEHNEKLLLLVTLVYAFFLSLLDPHFELIKTWMIRHYCHRTGKRHQRAKLPLYRLRWAFSRFWLEYRPRFSSTYFATSKISNTCSKSSG